MENFVKQLITKSYYNLDKNFLAKLCGNKIVQEVYKKKAIISWQKQERSKQHRHRIWPNRFVLNSCALGPCTTVLVRHRAGILGGSGDRALRQRCKARKQNVWSVRYHFFKKTQGYFNHFLSRIYDASLIFPTTYVDSWMFFLRARLGCFAHPASSTQVLLFIV